MNRTLKTLMLLAPLALAGMYLIGRSNGDDQSLLGAKLVFTVLWLAFMPLFDKLLKNAHNSTKSGIFSYLLDAAYVAVFYATGIYREGLGIGQLCVSAGIFIAIYSGFSFFSKRKLV